MRNESSSLAGQVVLITGGTQGIGLASARLMQADGAQVVLMGRSAERGRRVIDELSLSLDAFVRGDVSDPLDARSAVAAARERFGRLDALINNAAIDLSGVELVDTSDEAIREVFAVNAIGAIYMLREAAIVMRDQGSGSIVNVLSRAGLVGIAGMGIYGATKGALASITRAAAVELAPFSVRVNAVAPGATETPMMRTWIDEQSDPVEFERALVANLFEHRLAQPEEVARAIAFLAGPLSDYITGAVLSVDGGYTAS